MISSRRLAREWALKILYQVDVGKTSIDEASSAAMERLRKEFVQRGSRSASGSPTEEVCLDYITGVLGASLETMRAPLERACLGCIERALLSAPYWQEIYCEKSLKNRFKGFKQISLHLLPIVSEAPVYSADLTVAGTVSLTDDEVRFVDRFMRELIQNLPAALEKEMRVRGRKFARSLHEEIYAVDAPLLDHNEITNLINERRFIFNDEVTAHYARVSQMVRKQIGDWLSVASFTSRLVTGIARHQVALDESLTILSSGWKLQRQVAVDRNILRLAALEMLTMPAIPASASINEAVELAKKYSTAESGRFVNGVLGALASAETPAAFVGQSTDLSPEVELVDDLAEMTDVSDLDSDEVEADDTASAQADEDDDED